MDNYWDYLNEHETIQSETIWLIIGWTYWDYLNEHETIQSERIRSIIGWTIIVIT